MVPSFVSVQVLRLSGRTFGREHTTSGYPEDDVEEETKTRGYRRGELYLFALLEWTSLRVAVRCLSNLFKPRIRTFD
jgi:hypothetical protein